MKTIKLVFLLLMVIPSFLIAQSQDGDWIKEYQLEKGDLYHVLVGDKLVPTKDIISYLKKNGEKVGLFVKLDKGEDRDYLAPDGLGGFLGEQKELIRKNEKGDRDYVVYGWFNHRPCICKMKHGLLFTMDCYFKCRECCKAIRYEYREYEYK